MGKYKKGKQGRTFEQAESTIESAIEELGIESTLAVETQQCRSCLDYFDVTNDFFHVDASRSSGYSNICKECKKEYDTQRRTGTEAAEILAQVNEGAVDHLVSYFSRTRHRETQAAPNSGELVTAIMNAIGGVEVFAGEVAVNLFSSPVGSTGRIRLINMITNLVNKSTALGSTGLNIEDMTDEELKKYGRQTYKMMQQRFGDEMMNPSPPALEENSNEPTG